MEFGSGRLASYLFSFFSRQRVPPEEEEPQEEEQAQEEEQQEEQEQEPQEEEQEQQQQQQQQQQQPLPTAFQPHFPSLNRPTTTTTTTTKTRKPRTRITRPRTLYLGPGHSLSSKPTQQQQQQQHQQQQQQPTQNHALNLIKNTTPLRPSPLRNVTLATRTPPETHPTPAKKRKLKPASAIMSAVINQVNREIQTRSPAPSPIKPAEVINPYASLQRRPKQPPPNDPAQAPGESEARKRRLDGWLHPDTPSETRTPPQPPAEAILQQTMPKAYRQDAPARPKRKTGQVGSLPERLLKKQKLREERLRARSPAEPARRSPPTAVPGPPAETERPTKHTPVTAAAPNPSPDAAPPTGPPPTLTLTAPAATPLVRPPLPAAPASPKLTLLSPQQQHAEAPAEPRAAVIATVRALPPHHLRASYDLLRGFCAPRPPAPPGLLGGPGDGPVEHVLARVRAVECPRLPTFLLS